MTLENSNTPFDQGQWQPEQNAGLYSQDNDAWKKPSNSGDRAEKAQENARGAGDPKPGENGKGKKPKASPREQLEACVRATHDELVRHAIYRLGSKSAKPLNWHTFAYCWVTIARMIAPGRHREPPKPRGRKRARLKNSECREVMLRLSFDAIAVADQRRLAKIIKDAEDARDFARLRGDQTDAGIFEAIRERAERRLNWFERQEAKTCKCGKPSPVPSAVLETANTPKRRKR